MLTPTGAKGNEEGGGKSGERRGAMSRIHDLGSRDLGSLKTRMVYLLARLGHGEVDVEEAAELGTFHSKALDPEY